MKAVLDKLEKIYEEMVGMTAQAEQHKKLFNDKNKELEHLKETLDARENMLSARERIVKKVEEEEAQKEDLNTLKLEVQIHSQDLDKKEKELNDKLKKFEKDQAEHKLMVNAYRMKSERVSKLEAEMQELKKNMKKVVLKEIGDKLGA